MQLELHDRASRVETRDGLAEFIGDLLRDLSQRPENWENPTLDRYLEALSAWVSDMPGWFEGQGMSEPTEPSWTLVAQMLLAASIYE
jgi:hypothetical protein